MAFKWFEQGIFWNNFPAGQRANLKQFSQQTRKTYIRNLETPYVLFTGTTYIDFSFITRHERLVNKLVKKGLDIFLYEPVSLYIGDEHTHDYYSEFHSKNNSQAKASELDCISELVETTGIPVTVHTCDYSKNGLLQQSYPDMKIVCNDFFLKASINPQGKVPKKEIKNTFWCGNGRYTVHRHLVMAHLVTKPGAYSWHYTCRDLDKAFEPIDWISTDTLDKLRKNNKKLNKAYFSLDGRAPKLEIEDATKFYMPKKNFQVSMRFQKSYYDCFCAVVNETRFAQPLANFSEKTLQAMAAKLPLIMVAPPRTLEYLNELGFKSFSDFWDESYDLEENHEKRLLMIFDLIDKINNYSQEELESMYADMKDILEHNCKRLQELKDLEILLPS